MRAYQDLREFLSVLEQEQQLVRITDQVKFEPDLAAAACALARMGENSPAIIFNNIAGCSNAQVAMNVHGSWPNHALALGMDKDSPRRDQFFEFVRRFKQFPGELERVTTAPWQEVVVENNVNLFDLMPLFRLNRGDGGFYIDKACIVSRDPDDWDNDDVENVGCYRLMVKGPNRIGIQTVPQHDISVQLAHAEARGQDLPVAIAVANEPIILLMAATPLLYNQLEYKMAAAMHGKPYRVVKTANGLDVPYGSEYVLEGRLLARQREVEGPFGEFPGYYSGGHRYPVIEIDRVSHRKNPIFEAVYVGRPWTELDFLQAMTTSTPIFIQLNHMFPEVMAVQCALHARPRCHRVHESPLLRLRKNRRDGCADNTPRAWLRQVCDRRRCRRRSVQSRSGDVGYLGASQSGGRYSDHPQPCGKPARSRWSAGWNGTQDDH